MVEVIVTHTFPPDHDTFKSTLKRARTGDGIDFEQIRAFYLKHVILRFSAGAAEGAEGSGEDGEGGKGSKGGKKRKRVEKGGDVVMFLREALPGPRATEGKYKVVSEDNKIVERKISDGEHINTQMHAHSHIHNQIRMT
jgi:hypothetical protein